MNNRTRSWNLLSLITPANLKTVIPAINNHHPGGRNDRQIYKKSHKSLERTSKRNLVLITNKLLKNLNPGTLLDIRRKRISRPLWMLAELNLIIIYKSKVLICEKSKKMSDKCFERKSSFNVLPMHALQHVQFTFFHLSSY